MVRMDAQKKQLIYAGGSVFIVVFLSLYREAAMLFPSVLPIPQYFVYFGYMALLLLWIYSLSARLTQKTMRSCLQADALIMIFLMLLRYVQNRFLQENILLLRLSGYLILVPIVWIPLIGFFAACCVGRGDSYRIRRKWYLLCIPAALLTLLWMTDPLHHIVYAVVPEEPQPNLYFHPNIGVWLIMAWVIVMKVSQITIIMRRNRLLEHSSPFRRFLPFLHAILLVLFSIPFCMTDFSPTFHIVEFPIGISYIEVLSWEVCIYIGLIPVNTQHETVFHQSTVGMQILHRDGTCFTGSKNSVPVSPALFRELKKNGMVLTPEKQEIHLHPLQNGWMVWQKDVSALYRIIDRLHENEKALQEESRLLSKELATKSEKAAVQEKNRIYDLLACEVRGQLDDMLALLEQDGDPRERLKKISVIGAYVKQRCILRLIEQSEHRIMAEELAHSFRDVLKALEKAGICGNILLQGSRPLSPAFAISIYDIFWYALEYSGASVSSVRGCFVSPDEFLLEAEASAAFPLQSLERHCISPVHMNGKNTENGFRVLIWEGDDTNDEKKEHAPRSHQGSR